MRQQHYRTIWQGTVPECGEYIWIFEYIGHKYSDICLYQFFFYKYTWTFFCIKFVCTDIFGHSRQIFKYSYNFQDEYLGIRSCQIFWYKYIRIFARVNFFIQIYLCPNFHEYHLTTNTTLCTLCGPTTNFYTGSQVQRVTSPNGLSLRDWLWKVNLLLLKSGLIIDMCNWMCRGKGNWGVAELAGY